MNPVLVDSLVWVGRIITVPEEGTTVVMTLTVGVGASRGTEELSEIEPLFCLRLSPTLPPRDVVHPPGLQTRGVAFFPNEEEVLVVVVLRTVTVTVGFGSTVLLFLTLLASASL